MADFASGGVSAAFVQLYPPEAVACLIEYGGFSKRASFFEIISQGNPDMVTILTDFARSSFIQVGDLYAQTLQEMGVDVAHWSKERSCDADSSVILHNVFGRDFEPIPGNRNVALVVHEWSQYPPLWKKLIRSLEKLN